jgi:hypothetical protein
MKGKEQSSLHIQISADQAGIGTIKEYYCFSESWTFASYFKYPFYHAKVKSNCTLLRILLSVFTKNSTANNPDSIQGYLTSSPTVKKSATTCKGYSLVTNLIQCAPISTNGTKLLYDKTRLKRVIKKVKTVRLKGT